MKKFLVVLIILCTFVACTHFRLGVKVCDPAGNCVQFQTEIECDTCRNSLSNSILYNRN